MKLFICYRSIDRANGDKLIDELLTVSENSIAILKEIEHSDNWKVEVEKKMKESDFVVFLLGQSTFESDQIRWEYAKAKSLNKQIVGLKLTNVNEETILFCQGFQVFDNPKQAFKYLEQIFIVDRQLKIEQYKMMVCSTEKVTDQRMKVNNLFFTVTSSVLSLSAIIGKTFGFTPLCVFAIFILTLLALLITHAWENLINSYGKLNTGKFKVIDRIEKELRTNMFEEEWLILTKEINYEPNTKTERKIIKIFRIFISIALAIESIYLLYQLYQIFPICILICN